jgi:transcriptional regulator with XRE-family HTH domain
MFAEELTLSSENQLCQEMTVIESSVQTPQAQATNLEHQTVVALVEAQLSQSDVYCRAIESLQQVTAEQGIDGQILLKAVSLEAIRLTVETLSQQATLSQQQAPSVSDIAVESTVIVTGMPIAADEDAAEQEMFAAIEAVMQPGEKTHNPLASLLNQYKAKRQAAAAEELVMTREELLAQLGEQIALLREERGLSIAQLHARTFIPMYHLQALEGGHIEQLPEDIYLRGFLRRIENALNLETGALTDKMPSEVAASVIPEWYHRSQKAKRKSFAGLDVNPSHLYMTYAAIMAGGVCWLSNQSAPKAELPDLSRYEPRTQANANWQDRLNQQVKPQGYSSRSNPSQAGLKIGAAPNMAPPEMVR